MHRSRISTILVCTVLTAVPLRLLAENRFPRPDFSSGYTSPAVEVPAPTPHWQGWLDTGLLIAALMLASLFALRWRSRKGMVVLTIGCLLYFGFWRRGCVCPVGAVQNVAACLSGGTEPISTWIILFFLLPLLFSLLFGRVFCAAVCPLGAIQELFVVKPVHLPFWANRLLGLGRYAVLGLGIFAASTGVGFMICRHDPFVGFFRLGGPASALAIGLVFLLVGAFVGRPFCRFFCPLGVLLGWFSRLSWRRTTITPGECINCRLCESSCPYDAIEKPEQTQEEGFLEQSFQRRHMFRVILLLPLLTLAGWWLGGMLGPGLGRAHPDLTLADAVAGTGQDSSSLIRDRVEAFQASGVARDELLAKARAVRQNLERGGRWLGAYAGIVLGLHLVFLTRRIGHKDYRPDPSICVSCGRCFRYCPVEGPDRNHALTKRP